MDISETIYVLSGTSVTFKAVANPSTATFPSGQPTWGGTSNANGTGATISVPFPSASNSAGDFQTVTATAGGNTVTANVIVFSLAPTMTPANNFSGRTSLGVEEDATFAYQSQPSNVDVGGLRYKITTGGSGNGTLTANDTGGATYKAPDTAKSVAFKLEILSGPSKGNGPNVGLAIVEPSGATITRFSGIKHFVDTWSAGFLGDVHITPSNVSFYNLSFYEGSASANSSGWLAGFPGNHPQSSSAPRIDSSNTVHVQDEIFSGAKPGPYGDGEWYWDIPFHVLTNSNRDILFPAAVRQLSTSDGNGKAVISKGGASVSRVPSDPTSTY